MYVVNGTWGFMTLSSNSKSGYWSVVAKANSGTLSTGQWNAIDTDAADADRSQALGSDECCRKKGPHRVPTVVYLPHTSCYCDGVQTAGPLSVALREEESTVDPKNAVPDELSSKLKTRVRPLFPFSSAFWFVQLREDVNWKTTALRSVSLWYDEKNEQIED